MEKVKLFGIIFIIILKFCFNGLAQNSIDYRAWQFHKLDYDYVLKVLKIAPQYEINTVVFSHGMIGTTTELYDETKRSEELKKLAIEAHKLKLKVWIWVHELDNVPLEYLVNNKVELDKDGFWNWLKKRYEKVFKDFPEFDGLMLTFHETQYKIFDTEKINSNLSMPDRFAKLMNVISEVCKNYNKDFIVRTFVYEPEQMEWVRKGLLKSDKSIMIQSKCVPHDWDPYYPHNPLIGAFPDRKQIIEFDCSSEFTGKNRIPFTSPEYFEYRWKYDLQKQGVAGYNARIDHGGFDAIYTPNEINLYTLFRITQDKKLTSKDIWKEWTIKNYGEKAAPILEKALFNSFEVVKKSFFPLKFWITDHSSLPSFEYAQKHITSRTISKWIPDQPIYKEIENRLLHPNINTLEEILAEKDSAIVLADESLLLLNQAKKFITTEKFEDLYWRLELLQRTAIIWKHHSEAFFGLKVLMGGNKTVGLSDRVKKAIDALYIEAEISKLNPKIGNLPPSSEKEIRESADELKMLLNQFINTL